MTHPSFDTAPFELIRAATDQETEDLENAVRDFAPRFERLRELGVPERALVRIYATTSKICGQKSVFDAVNAIAHPR